MSIGAPTLASFLLEARMPLKLFVDTETTGLDAPAIVELGAALFDGPREVASLAMVFNLPAGKAIHPKAVEAHGYTEADCARLGVSPAAAIQPFIAFCMAADELVGHNLNYDFPIISAWLKNYAAPSMQAYLGLPTFCTMRAMTPIMKLPGKFPNTFKWPRLGEAYTFCTGLEQQGAHGAIADVRACAAVYNSIKTNKYHGQQNTAPVQAQVSFNRNACAVGA